MFDEVLGHERIKLLLSHMIEQNKVPHALLFAGKEGIGKKTLAISFAARLLNAPLTRLSSGHPDFFSFFPDGKSGIHSIDEVRKITDIVYQAPFESKRRVVLINAAERMQPAASNAFLKTLEEPLETTHLFLISAAPQDLLPTIHSRLMTLSFNPLPKPFLEELLKKRSLSSDFANWADGSIGKAIEMAEQPELESARKILFSLLQERPSYPEVSIGVEQIDRLLETEDPLLKMRRQYDLFSMVASFYLHSDKRPKNLDEILEKIRLGLERNLKFTACLEIAFHELYTPSI